jgi:hypothetical protein
MDVCHVFIILQHSDSKASTATAKSDATAADDAAATAKASTATAKTDALAVQTAPRGRLTSLLIGDVGDGRTDARDSGWLSTGNAHAHVGSSYHFHIRLTLRCRGMR